MAWNAPQWGNNGNRPNARGPPDLAELWRRLNPRLIGMFGNRNSEGGGGFSSGGAGGGKLLGLLRGALFLGWVASGFYIVDTGQRGVVLRFGKYIEPTEPGPRWHLPWPLESRVIVN